MSNLTQRIDSMSQPTFPEYFGMREREIIFGLLSVAKERIRPYHGDYTAPWLLSDFEADEWITTNRGREEKIDDQWKNVFRINWAVPFSNGKKLTDPMYRQLLTVNRRLAFLNRSGYIGNINSLTTWRAVIYLQLLLSRWMVLHETRFQPEKYAFKLLDQYSVDSLFSLLAEGGWTAAQQIPQRLLSKLYQLAINQPCPQHLFSSMYELPPALCRRIIKWLQVNNYYIRIYKGAYVGGSYLSRAHIAAAISESAEIVRNSEKINAFIRQFEPDLQIGSLLIGAFQTTEMPNHNTPTVKMAITNSYSENSLWNASRDLTTILSAHRQLPDALPEPHLISIRSAHDNALRHTRAPHHTPFMPVGMGLSYLNRAMSFVHLYGEAIVEYYLAVLRSTSEADMRTLDKAQMNIICNSFANAGYLVRIGGIDKCVAEALGIKRFHRIRSEASFNLLRTEPTLDESLSILIGACVVCLALLKPSREDELTHLKKTCLRQGDDGYYLHYTRGKSNAKETHQETDRPIPAITARAIQLLQKLGSGLKDIFHDERKIADNLFYLPRLDGYGALAATANLLNQYLDIFCDYVALPPDPLGRRWYVRIHEMRKWFLLLLFWAGRYDVLDAARWIAGHTDASHIYAYIEREFPGEELPKLEAEYAIERLREMESSSNPAHVESGLGALYTIILRHFQVRTLSMVPDAEWSDYVSALREVDGFFLEPHSVYADNGTEVIGINVSFVLREAKS